LGGGFISKFFGFRKDPYSSKHSLRTGFAFRARALRLDYHGEFRRENSNAYTSIAARVSGLEIFRFYGFGNETTSTEDDDFYKVEQRQYSFDLSFTLPLEGSFSLNLGPIVKYSTTNLNQNNLISAIRPYGSENFGQIGFHGRIAYDTRDVPPAPTRGTHIFLDGKYYPSLLDVKSGFGYLHFESSTYITASSISLQPSFAVRIGSELIFGEYPFHEAAFIGGGGIAHSGSTVRGFFAQRFAGDSSVYGNAELRLRLSKIYVFFPGEIGLFFLGDVGRVYFDGENSKKWHSAIGGGLWFSILGRKNTISVSLAKSDERLGLYISGGFSF
jgi:outer membrane protein assembly factor BamA